MSDGIAPAVDKVGAPEPTAPEAQAHAPTMDTTAPVTASADAKDFAATNGDTTKPIEETKPDEPAPNPLEGAGPAVSAPKPVEVNSVPETPVNNGTPAGGTPRPELAFDRDAKKPEAKADDDDPVISDAQNASENAVNGDTSEPKMTGALQTEPVEELEVGGKPVGEKRKAEEAIAPLAEDATATSSDSGEKKAKVDENGTAVPTPVDGKGTKAKKEKKPAPPVGRTARKTRSQGPVEV